MSSSGEELWRKSARETVRLLKDREVTPLELIDAAEARIGDVGEQTNAVPICCFDRARQHAKRIGRSTSAASGRGQLHGLPIVVKDLTAVEGVRWTEGSRAFADRVAAYSDLSVRRLEANGAIVIGKSNTPEFGAGGNTVNRVFGATPNPWNSAYTSGGSSGGSAVAVATGQSWLATGSDMAGSIRIPASFCSVTGIRPSPGRIPRGPLALPFGMLLVDGPIARSVGDAALMLDAMIEENVADPLTLPLPRVPFVDAADAPAVPKTIGWSENLSLGPVDPEVRRVCETALKKFEELGSVVENACPDLSGADRAFQVLRNLQRAAASPLVEEHASVLDHEIVHYTGKGLELTAKEISEAEVERGRVYRSMQDFFERFDVLATPTVLSKPIPVGTKHLMAFEGHEFDDYFGWLVLTYAITLTACPAISIPCGFTSEGLPVGLQLVARLRDEHRLISTASAFEQATNHIERLPIDPHRSG